MSILQSCRIGFPAALSRVRVFCPAVWFPIALHYIVRTPAVQQNLKTKYGKIHDWREKCAIRRNRQLWFFEWRDAGAATPRRKQTAKQKKKKKRTTEMRNGNAADAKPHEARHRPAKSNCPVSPDGTHSLEGGGTGWERWTWRWAGRGRIVVVGWVGVISQANPRETTILSENDFSICVMTWLDTLSPT